MSFRGTRNLVRFFTSFRMTIIVNCALCFVNQKNLPRGGATFRIPHSEFRIFYAEGTPDYRLLTTDYFINICRLSLT